MKRKNEDTVSLRLTIKELCFLENLINGGVGGDPEGPRRYADSIQEKVVAALTQLGILQYADRPVLFDLYFQGHLEAIETKRKGSSKR